ncbi:RpiB/LacA/LacB family sugar-phosphate isomerase [Patescibacteria group bacterium]|nr:RpiB/LacA/LacB family sugar-phosphate isomerase [Patescibacteria group bacterium]
MNKPTIHIGADHRGYCLKYDIKKYLYKKGYNVVDHGNHRYQAKDDFPDFGKKVCQEVAQNKKQNIGILICGSGVGMDILANKTKCIRAALCWNHKVAASARNDDDPHVLILPADFITKAEAKKTVGKFIKTPFSGKIRNKRRLKQILFYEKCSKKS